MGGRGVCIHVRVIAQDRIRGSDGDFVEHGPGATQKNFERLFNPHNLSRAETLHAHIDRLTATVRILGRVSLTRTRHYEIHLVHQGGMPQGCEKLRMRRGQRIERHGEIPDSDHLRCHEFEIPEIRQDA